MSQAFNIYFEKIHLKNKNVESVSLSDQSPDFFVLTSKQKNQDSVFLWSSDIPATDTCVKFSIGPKTHFVISEKEKNK